MPVVLVKVRQVVAGRFGMGAQVEVGAVGDTADLAPSPGELVLDVDGRLRVVGQLVGLVFPEAQALLRQPKMRVPVLAFLGPAGKPLLVVAGLDEVLEPP